jgi:hypothetical protein
MASEPGIWGDRDSSNDFRSSTSDSDSESEGGGIKLPVRGELKTVNGEVLGQGLERGIGTRMRKMRDLEILSSTVEQFQALSQSSSEAVSSAALLRNKRV